MSSLEKAKAALEAAREVPGPDDSRGRRLPCDEERFSDLLSIAQIHANIAQAEALEAIADALEKATAVR